MEKKKPKWDGKSRVSNEKYRKRFNEIFWKDEWQDMPEFKMKDLTSEHSIIVHFENEKDLRDFAELVDQNIYTTTKSIWYPKLKIERFMNKRYIDEEE